MLYWEKNKGSTNWFSIRDRKLMVPRLDAISFAHTMFNILGRYLQRWNSLEFFHQNIIFHLPPPKKKIRSSSNIPV